jgi:5,10-methenyltetrahydrofolate synthetase
MDDDAELKAWRREQRQRLLALRIALPPEQRRAASQAITDRLLAAFPALQERGVIAAYWPFKGEFDPRHALRHWRARGARVAMPVVVQKGAPLQFREWWPGAPMTRGLFDMPVPEGTEELIPQVLLIPPVGFDAQGYRLGYGGGFYDRTLAGLPAATLKIGVAFELSRLPGIRPRPHDIRMDCIVTEAGVHPGDPR